MDNVLLIAAKTFGWAALTALCCWAKLALDRGPDGYAVADPVLLTGLLGGSLVALLTLPVFGWWLLLKMTGQVTRTITAAVREARE